MNSRFTIGGDRAVKAGTYPESLKGKVDACLEAITQNAPQITVGPDRLVLLEKISQAKSILSSYTRTSNKTRVEQKGALETALDECQNSLISGNHGSTTAESPVAAVLQTALQTTLLAIKSDHESNGGIAKAKQNCFLRLFLCAFGANHKSTLQKKAERVVSLFDDLSSRKVTPSRTPSPTD